MTSEQLQGSKTIHTAILEVMRQVGYVQKESAAGLNYTFASERALIEAIRPAIIEAGITMYVAGMDDLREGEVLSKKGNVAQYARVTLAVVFTHAASDTSIRVQVPGGAMDYGDKAISKALTMAYKYALRQTFIIETGDDPDTENPGGDGNMTGAVYGGGQDVKRKKVKKPPQPRPAVEQPQRPATAPAQAIASTVHPDWAKDVGQPPWLADPSARTTQEKSFKPAELEQATRWGIEIEAFPKPDDSPAAKEAHGQAVRMILLKSPMLPGFTREQFEAFVRPYSTLKKAGESTANAAAGACETFEDNLAEMIEQNFNGQGELG